MTLAEI